MEGFEVSKQSVLAGIFGSREYRAENSGGFSERLRGPAPGAIGRQGNKAGESSFHCRNMLFRMRFIEELF